MSASSTIFVFPGQGSQHSGMAAEFMSHPTTGALFEEANDTLGFDITSLMREGDAAELTQTINAQPALFIASAAALTYFLKQTNSSITDHASYVAGHSLGEYSALWAAGCMDFATGLKLVRARGEAMAKPLEIGDGAMAAIIGEIPVEQIESIANNAGCWVANDNAEGQTVISGSNMAVDRASNIAVMENVRKVMRLDVSAPFHCPLMQGAALEMEDMLTATTFNDPVLPVISNVTAQPMDTAEPIVDLLTRQITDRVRWRESMQWAAEQGITRVYEFGSGHVLTGLAKRCDKNLKGICLNSPEDIDSLLESLEAAA